MSPALSTTTSPFPAARLQCFNPPMQISTGIITISDRASKGLYDDLGGPALKQAAEGHGWKVLAEALVPDEKRDIQRAIREQIAGAVTAFGRPRYFQ